MKKAFMHNKVRTIDIIVLIQAAIFGFLVGEVWALSQIIGSVFNPYIKTFDKPFYILALCGILALLGYVYFDIRNGHNQVLKLLKCNRVDLFAIIIIAGLGLLISIASDGVGASKYQEYVGKVQAFPLMLIVAIPVGIALMLVLRALINSPVRNEPTPFFLNDQAIKDSVDDLLELGETASRFAEKVLNGGSSDSLVFGIDSPWGIGKSSFVNFCCEYWQKNYPAEIIVHRFEPLRYKDGADLVDKFVNELVNSIKEHAYIPSIESLFAKYLRLIKSKNDLSLFGLKFEFGSGTANVDEILETLEARLSELNKKIIVVIDDLDRLSWPEVKNILFAVKRSFMLPNVSYVLCYDTQNLISLEKESDDAEKVREFLEKFVNVKIGLYLDSNILAKFVDEDINAAINKNLQLDVHLLNQIKQALTALVDVYKSNDYPLYQDMLGDVRKVKRLINTMMLFEIQKTDFENSDFNKQDLMHLMLIYINYPNIFRKIYNAETGGKAGFFSLEREYQKGSSSSEFVNSSNYSNYTKNLTENQKFVLDKLFTLGDEFTEKKKKLSETSSRACFNGEGTRNLERYLNLIVKIAKQNKREAYQFYVNKKDALLNGVSIDNIFEGDDFSFSEGDFSRDELWGIIANSAYELKPHIGSSVVIYLIENLPDYSFFEQEKVGAGSRVNLVYSLLKLLDEAGWGTGLRGRRNNTEENISEIAEWVFGEGRHVGAGIITTLSKAERGPLGLFDLLLFRLYCSADRGSSLFNLQRAISLHGNPSAPTAGITTEIAREGMREISQKVFHVFSKQYIQPKKNIFEAIDNLSLDDFAGQSAGFVRNQVKLGEVSQEEIDDLIARERSRVKVFIIYQLGNSIISSGVGCGYYDETGNGDQKGIAKKVNNYLFDFCFNPKISQENYERFLDYLLLNFAHTFGGEDGANYVPSTAEFTKVLESERLKKYWRRHRKSIMALDLNLKKKRVVTGNYIATYEHDLQEVYRVLDGAD